MKDMHSGQISVAVKPVEGVCSYAHANQLHMPTPQIPLKSTKLHVGQRAPERDLIGGIRAPWVRKAARCSLTEGIEVVLSQVEEAEVSRFEYPTCLAVRDIKPNGDRVKFSLAPQTHGQCSKSTIALGEARNRLETFRLLCAK